MVHDSRDVEGEPAIHLRTTGFSKQGCGRLLGPLMPAREVVPPFFLWILHGRGSTTITGREETQREQNWVRRTQLRQVGITQRSERHTRAVSNHSNGGLL